MKQTLLTALALAAAAVLPTSILAQGAGPTLIPKWSNTTVFANQASVNGGAYNPATGNLLVCQAYGSTAGIVICRPSDGASTGTLNTNGVTGGTYALSGLTIDANGVIYVCNYAAAGGAKLYSWANEGATPVNFASSTLGAGNVGLTMGMWGAGNSAVFILSSSTTGPLYVYYDGSAWQSKQLTVSSGTVQGGLSIVSWSATSCAFITKNGSGLGYYNTFNPSLAGPITVSQTYYTSVPLAAVTLSGTTTPVQGAGAYDPVTGLFGFHTRSLTASPYSISNYLVLTTNSTLAAPGGCTPVASAVGVTTSGTDSSTSYGADFWGNGVFYSVPAQLASRGFGFRAYDVNAFKVTDISPGAATKNVGDSVSFSVVSGGSGLTYQWYLDTGSGPVAVSGSEYSGTASNRLTINPVGVADAGTYTCFVTGSYGYWTSSGGVLTVQGSVPPIVMNCPSTLIVAATSTNGAQVYYSTTNLVSGGCNGTAYLAGATNVTFGGSALPGALFPVGTNLVAVYGQDSCSNSASCTFAVLVTAYVPPIVMNCPSTLIVAATSTNGAQVYYSTTNLVSGGCNGTAYLAGASNVTFGGSALPGALFPVGTNLVVVSGRDSCSNSASCTFAVLVTAYVPPIVLTCASNLTVAATGTNGAVVYFANSASGGCTTPTISCYPPSGSLFPVGATPVYVTARDTCGNSNMCSFTVTVLPPISKWFYTGNLLPPANGMTLQPAPLGITFPGGIIISNVSQRFFGSSNAPPNILGGSVTASGACVMELDVSLDGGATWHSCVISNVPFTFGITNNGSDSGDTLYMTELTQLNVSGGTLPAGVQIRESPTKASLGQTRIQPDTGGYQIASFFNIFLEVSTDNGSTWVPAGGACTVQWQPDPMQYGLALAPRDVFPMPNAQWVGSMQGYGNGVILKNIRHKLFSGWGETPIFGASQTYSFESQYDFQLSTDGGTTFYAARAPSTCTIGITNVRVFEGRSVYDTECTQLDISGGDLPAGVMIRESPTKVSRGGTSSLAGGGGGGAGGGAAISSFFDIFTEISTDGGSTWTPATNGPCHWELGRIAPVYEYTNNLMPSLQGQYISTQQWWAYYADGIVLTNVVIRNFTTAITPPLPGFATSDTFGATVDFWLSLDGGLTYNHTNAGATVSIQTTARLGDDGVTEYYDTEMTQLSISGPGLPAGVQIRESPTKQSLGRTTTSGPGGGGGGSDYQIDSFFDIYTEISTDGGMSWLPTIAGPAEVQLVQAVAAPPIVLTCSSNLTVAATGTNGAVVWFTNSASGGCTTPTISCYPSSGSTFPVGTTTVYVTARDTCGYSNTCSFTVTVTLPPIVLSCPSIISVTATSTAGAVVTYTTTVLGGCGAAYVTGATNLMTGADASSGALFPVGTNLVAAYAADNCGQTANCIFPVTVAPYVPPSGPIFNLLVTTSGLTNARPGTPLVATFADPSQPSASSGTRVTEGFDSPTGRVVSMSFVPTTNFQFGAVALRGLGAGSSNSVFYVALYHITNDVTYPSSYRPQFEAANLLRTNLVFRYLNGSGNDQIILLAFTNSLDQVSLVASNNYAFEIWRDAIAETNVLFWVRGSAGISQYGTQFPQVPRAFEVNAGNVTATNQDGSLAPPSDPGNLRTPLAGGIRDLVMAVYTSQNLIATNPPIVLACPSNITVAATSGNGAVVAYAAPTVSGGCAPITVTSSPPSGSTFPVGTTTVTVTARDTCTNSVSCTFTVTVTPYVPPLSISCPSNITVAATGTNGAVVGFTPSATGGCSSPTVISSPPSGSTFPVGTTTVTVTARDTCSNSVSCTFTVTVTPYVPPPVPIVPTCPSNITVAATSSNGAVVAYSASVSGGCNGSAIITSNVNMTTMVPVTSGSTFPVGTNVVAVYASDGCGQTATCSFTVTVTPYVAPLVPVFDLLVTTSGLTNAWPGTPSVATFADPSLPSDGGGTRVPEQFDSPTGRVVSMSFVPTTNFQLGAVALRGLGAGSSNTVFYVALYHITNDVTYPSSYRPQFEAANLLRTNLAFRYLNGSSNDQFIVLTFTNSLDQVLLTANNNYAFEIWHDATAETNVLFWIRGTAGISTYGTAFPLVPRGFEVNAGNVTATNQDGSMAPPSDAGNLRTPLAGGIRDLVMAVYTSQNMIVINPPAGLTPPVLGGITLDAVSGAFGFNFTNAPGINFGVYCATSLAPPVAWQKIGQVTETLQGSCSLYQFTDPQAGTKPALFYRVSCP